jgi:tRNA threonylcarbamoyladenosine biosynthesis protein TsaB
VLILALDTTSAGGSVALARDGQLVDETTGDPTLTHGQRLPGDLQSLLARHDVTTDAVDRYAVAAGPGSFTGLRVGIATIQGLALAHDKRVVAISVLDTLVEIAAQLADRDTRGPDLIAPWVNAKRGEVFGALYQPAPSMDAADTRRPTGDPRRTAGDRWRVAVEPVAVPPVALLDTWADTLATRRVWAIGDGVAAYQSVLTDRLGPGSRTIHETPPLAGVMAVMASVEPWCRQAVAPHALRPVYVRRPDAELARERRRRLDVDGGSSS